MSTLLDHLEHKPHHLTMRDISAWNGTPSISSLDTDIVAIKATEGTGYKSPVFQRDWLNAREAKKARMAYHFFHPSVSALAQARFFLDTVKNGELKDGDCLALDHEETDGLDAVITAKAARDFRKAVEDEANCKLVIYTYINFAKAGNCEGLGNSPLWIADPSHPANHPEVPHPWDHWYFHQHGQRRGIDFDVCNFDSLGEFYKLAVLPKPPPLTPNQRMVKLTDGKVHVETLIEIGNFKTGFKIKAGDAVLEVIEDGLPKTVI